MRQVIVMVTTSYPRFPGDSVGTFMEPIAKSVAALGHEVHLVAPWHPLIARGGAEDGVRFHFYKYAPIRSLNVFGYAAAMRADVRLRAAAYVVAPLALASGWAAARRVARGCRATVMHGHWVVPGGVTSWLAAPRLPLVISLHGSDVYVAETLAPARFAARTVLRKADAVTACSSDLARRAIALGASPDRVQVIPYGVDIDRFRPSPSVRSARRAAAGVGDDGVLVFAAGRLVRKKGFEYLIDALPLIDTNAHVILTLAGEGDLNDELYERARSRGVLERVRFLGNINQDDVAGWLAAADIVVVPSVRDDSGNVDGLPNVVLEAMASGTALVTTAAGGIGAVADDSRTALVVPERDAAALARAITALIADPAARSRLGSAARSMTSTRFGWNHVGEQLDSVYARVLAIRSGAR